MSNTESGDFFAKSLFGDILKLKFLRAFFGRKNSKWGLVNLQFNKTNFDRNLAILTACFLSMNVVVDFNPEHKNLIAGTDEELFLSHISRGPQKAA